MTPDQIKTVQALVDALETVGEWDHRGESVASEWGNDGGIGYAALIAEGRALIAQMQQEAQAAPAEDRSPHTVMTLDIRHYPEPKPDGSWAVFGPSGSGLLVAHASIDVAMGDVLPAWRALRRLAPSQVPPVPPAPPQAAQEPADEAPDSGESRKPITSDAIHAEWTRIKAADDSWSEFPHVALVRWAEAQHGITDAGKESA